MPYRRTTFTAVASRTLPAVLCSPGKTPALNSTTFLSRAPLWPTTRVFPLRFGSSKCRLDTVDRGRDIHSLEVPPCAGDNDDAKHRHRPSPGGIFRGYACRGRYSSVDRGAIGVGTLIRLKCLLGWDDDGVRRRRCHQRKEALPVSGVSPSRSTVSRRLFDDPNLVANAGLLAITGLLTDVTQCSALGSSPGEQSTAGRIRGAMAVNVVRRYGTTYRLHTELRPLKSVASWVGAA